MRNAHWIKEHLVDVHFLTNGATGGWTVKTWVGFVGGFITTEHAGEMPPSIDDVVDTVLAKISST